MRYQLFAIITFYILIYYIISFAIRYQLSAASTVTPLRINHWQPRIAASSYLFTVKITAGNSRSSSRFEEELEIWGGSWNLRQMEKGWILTCWRPPSNLPSYQTLARIIILFLHPAPPNLNSTQSSNLQQGRYYPQDIILPLDSSGLSLLHKQANNDQPPLVTLVIWDYCKRWSSFHLSRASKPQLYNWHFHSPRSCSSWLGPGRDWMVLKR